MDAPPGATAPRGKRPVQQAADTERPSAQPDEAPLATHYQDDVCTLLQGDFLQGLRSLPDASIDLLLTDPPYGTTSLAWDKKIDLEAFWAEVHRVCKPEAVIVSFAAQPFTTDLINSNRKCFRYELIWHKTVPVGFLDAAKRPLRSHENILVFCLRFRGAKNAKLSTYNPQFTAGTPYTRKPCGIPAAHYSGKLRSGTVNTGYRHPRSVLQYCNKQKPSLHPTQKPQDLAEWLVLTYSNPGELVLDPFAGSGTTLAAAKGKGRRCIGIERSLEYCDTIKQRLAAVEVPE